MTATETDDFLELPLTLRVPRKTLVVVAAPPATVTQKTAETHFGIPEGTFKMMVREGLFPAKRIGRLLFASYDAVRVAVTVGAEQNARFRKAGGVNAIQTQEPIDVEEAARYLASAQTPAEYRRRREELHAIAGDLSRRFDETLPDGSRNPNFDKRLSDHAMSLYYRVTVEDVSRRAARPRRTTK